MGDVLRGIALPMSVHGRSSTVFSKAVLADAVRHFDADLSQAVEAARKWRSEYAEVYRATTAVSACSPEASIGIATAGLGSARALLRYVDRTGESALDDGQWRSDTRVLDARTIDGTASVATTLRVPFDGKLLEGDALRGKLAELRDRGVVEPSFMSAIDAVIDNPKWLALPGYHVVLLGAGAEIGPLVPLMNWGADVFAIDLPTSPLWESLPTLARTAAGSVTYPVGATGRPGADLTTDFPMLLPWIYANTGKKRRKTVLGMYAYTDGIAHVTASAAADVLAQEVLERRPATTLAYLGTPTDVYAVRADVVAESRRRFGHRGVSAPLENVLRVASRSALFRENYRDEVVDFEGRHWGLASSIIGAQGPNYLLAKRLQRWRALVARAAGRSVSFNVAPASFTKSAMSNRVLASAYKGAPHFGVEVFDPATTRTLMAAKLVADIFAPAPVDPTANPEELFYEGAAHGGIWRQPFEPSSAFGIAAAAGYPRALLRR